MGRVARRTLTFIVLELGYNVKALSVIAQHVMLIVLEISTTGVNFLRIVLLAAATAAAAASYVLHRRDRSYRRRNLIRRYP